MNKKIKIGIFTGSILIAVAVLLGIIINQPAYTFTMDVNPSIEIKSNRLNKVVEINPLNEDAKNLLKDFKHKDKSLQKTIEDLADLMVLKGNRKGWRIGRHV